MMEDSQSITPLTTRYMIQHSRMILTPWTVRRMVRYSPCTMMRRGIPCAGIIRSSRLGRMPSRKTKHGSIPDQAGRIYRSLMRRYSWTAAPCRIFPLPVGGLRSWLSGVTRVLHWLIVGPGTMTMAASSSSPAPTTPPTRRATSGPHGRSMP